MPERRARDRLAVLGLAVLAAVLSLYNLRGYPSTWYDEGWWLQIPKNLALAGEYASVSSEGYRYGDTIISASPVFYLPAAGAFALFGTGLLQARLVMAGLFLLACTLVYAVGRRAYGAGAGLLATLLFVLVKPDDDFTSALVLGRQFMAEIPSLCWLLLGLWLWVGLDDSRRPHMRAGTAGLSFGMAMAIKSQFGMPLIATIAVLAGIDWLQGRRRVSVFAGAAATAVLVVALHVLGIYLFLGRDFTGFLDDYQSTGRAVAGAAYSMPSRLAAARFFARSEYSWIVLAALTYAFWEMWRDRPFRIGLAVLPVFSAIWWGWFAFLSVGWARYTFPALAIGHLLTATFLIDVAGWRETTGATSPLSRPWWKRAAVRQSGVAALIAAACIGTSRTVLIGIATGSNAAATKMAAFVDDAIPPGERVETWEWEIVFLSRRTTFHVPPTRMLPSLMIRMQTPGAPLPRGYAIDPTQTGYLLIGPFATWTAFYAVHEPESRWTLKRREGPYALYRAPTP